MEMMQKHHDGIVIIGMPCKADAFITMTANPRRKEVQDALLPGERAAGRRDIVSGVFNLKVKQLMQDSTTGGLLGRVVGYMYIIRCQKLVLPHAYILMILADNDKLKTLHDYDVLVCAEIPVPEKDPELYEFISNCKMHGPSGSLNPNCPCMEEGVCKIGFLKEFRDEGRDNDNGYPLCRRRNNGRIVRSRSRIPSDNRRVVPCNPALSLRSECHNNVEFCASVQSVKYLHKYIYKCHDRANLVVDDEDEFKLIIHGRYISTSEAMLPIFGFDLHNKSPGVIRPQVHLPQEQSMMFDSQAERGELEQLAEERGTTTLTAWLEANVKYLERRHLVYSDYVEPFVYKSTLAAGERSSRKRNIGQNVGCMYSAPPSAGERYFLRLLLNHVPGATSFPDLQTYNAVVYPSFQEACRQRGLLDDDTEWRNCLRELLCHNHRPASVVYSSKYLSLTVPKIHILYGANTKHPCLRT